MVKKFFNKFFRFYTKKSAACHLWILGSALKRDVSQDGQTIDTAFSIGVLSVSE